MAMPPEDNSPGLFDTMAAFASTAAGMILIAALVVIGAVSSVLMYSAGLYQGKSSGRTDRLERVRLAGENAQLVQQLTDTRASLLETRRKAAASTEARKEYRVAYNESVRIGERASIVGMVGLANSNRATLNFEGLQREVAVGDRFSIYEGADACTITVLKADTFGVQFAADCGSPNK